MHLSKTTSTPTKHGCIDNQRDYTLRVEIA
jgi:hypothetical protein